MTSSDVLADESGARDRQGEPAGLARGSATGSITESATGTDAGAGRAGRGGAAFALSTSATGGHSARNA